MNSFDLKKSLDELHQRSKTGEVEWNCGDNNIKTRLGDLVVVIKPDGTVRFRIIVELDHPPHEAFRSKTTFQHDTAHAIYETVQCLDAPESVELFKGKMLDD